MIYRIAVAKQDVYPKDMTIAEQQRKEREQYRTVLPGIVVALTERREPVAFAQEIAEHHDLDQRQVYRWLQLTEEQLEARRKRVALWYLLWVWLGALDLAVLTIGALLSRFSLQDIAFVVPAVAGGVVLLVSAIRLPGLRRRVYQRWMERELAS